MSKQTGTQRMDREERIAREIDALREEYYRLSKPYIDIKMRIYNLSLPEITINKEGVEYKYNFTDKQKDTIVLIDETLKSLKEKTEQQMEKLYRYYV